MEDQRRHPRGTVDLGELAAGGKRLVAVEHPPDVVHAEEPTAEHAAVGLVLLIQPPHRVEGG